jgi:tetrahydromethanopterin S-methyltransferase subunit B
MYPESDYSETHCSIGRSNERFYQVWSSSFNFASGAYINYNAANDYIYASKTIQQASDESLKNIAPYDDKYDDLLDVLEPVLYTWRSHPEGARYVGLGARKTAKLLEDCGIENSGFVGINQDEDGNEIYSIDYNELSAMLLHKVQKQEKRIKELETTLNDVLERLKRLEA